MTLLKQFKHIVSKTIKRDGIENLMEWLENETDFFSAPASTRYHGAYEGGLVEHSLNVYTQLTWEMEHLVGEGWEEIYSPETVAIVALFHDICKIDRYTIEEKWRKDQNGDWEPYEAYVYNQDKPEMGHGAQSVFYLQKFMQLTELEAQAIYWHMGAYDISTYSSVSNCSNTFEANPLAFLMHRADMGARYVLENDYFVYSEGGEPIEKKAEAEEQVAEEKEKPTRRRATKKAKEEPVEEEAPKEETTSKITRRRKPKAEEAPKDEPEAEAEEKEAESKPSSIRRPRKRAEKAEAPKTYYFYSEADDVYYKKDVNAPDDDSDILVDEEEYLDAMSPILEEDFFYKLGGKVHKLAKGERLPEEYDEETWIPITEAQYLEDMEEKPKQTVPASRKRPTPSGRPRPRR